MASPYISTTYRQQPAAHAAWECFSYSLAYTPLKTVYRHAIDIKEKIFDFGENCRCFAVI